MSDLQDLPLEGRAFSTASASILSQAWIRRPSNNVHMYSKADMFAMLSKKFYAHLFIRMLQLFFFTLKVAKQASMLPMNRAQLLAFVAAHFLHSTELGGRDTSVIALLKRRSR